MAQWFKDLVLSLQWLGLLLWHRSSPSPGSSYVPQVHHPQFPSLPEKYCYLVFSICVEYLFTSLHFESVYIFKSEINLL